MKRKTIYEVCKQVDQDILGDFGGGSPLSKTFLMAYLARSEQLKTFVEIGVYRGRSLFPVAYSIFLNDGITYGIDPYLLCEALESDVDPDLKKSLDDFLVLTNFDQIYSDVMYYKKECGYGDSIQIIRKTSANAHKDLSRLGVHPDFLHIDGNHDSHNVLQDFETYLPLMKDGSYIVFDDINWASVRPVYHSAKEKCVCIFETQEFGILMKTSEPDKAHNKAIVLQQKLNAIYRRIISIQFQKASHLPIVAVGVLTYNHARYITQALQSILAQSGEFRLRLIICDDASSDDTVNIIRSIAQSPNNQIEVSLNENQVNVGMSNNFRILIDKIKESGCDYFTFCEGDDYYLASNRISQLLALAMENPDKAVLWNRVCIFFQDEERYEIFHPSLIKDNANTEDLVAENFIGNLNASFLRSDVLDYIDNTFDDVSLFADWFFHLYCSQYGDIQLLNQPLTLYRKHQKGYWSSMPSLEKATYLLGQIDQYDMKLKKLFSSGFETIKNRLETTLIESYNFRSEGVDLLIVDNIYPSRLSGFRFEEYTYLLNNIPNSLVLASGAGVSCLGSHSHSDNIDQFSSTNSRLAARVVSTFEFQSRKPSLLYTIFIGQVYHDVLPLAEAYRIPFAFTLYPGGGFGVDNSDSDRMLRRVFASPFFSRVIVTQEVTLRYLLESKFCSPDKIKYIYGVPTPAVADSSSHFRCTLKPGIDRPLNICFVAHKYTQGGIDKGYDVFLEVVNIVSKRLAGVSFHVVGPWDPEDVPALDSENHPSITYYGSKEQDWFDDFYRDKDIILCPNIDGLIYKGSFDGFPTGCAIDAALRGVVMLATDPLDMNCNRFEPGQDLVIISRDPIEISQLICYFHDNPDMLKMIGIRGSGRVSNLFSAESQLLPRLDFIKDCLNEKPRPPRAEWASCLSHKIDDASRKAFSLLSRAQRL